MWIAIAATGPTLDSLISPSCTRTSHFILVDVESGQYHAFANPNAYDPATNDFPIAESLLGAGVCIVLAQHCSPEIQHILQKGGVKLFTHVEGTVSEAIGQYRQGCLQPVDVYQE
jgi:predicted Fe-Mo cluster-binding NifX family protein